MSVFFRLLRIRYPRWPLSVGHLQALNVVYHLIFMLVHVYYLTIKVMLFYMKPELPTGLMIVTVIQHIFGISFHTACYLEPVLDELFDGGQPAFWQVRRLIQLLDAFSHRLLVDLTLVNVVSKAILLYPYPTVHEHLTLLLAVLEFLCNAWCSQIPVVARLPDLGELFAAREVGQGDG